MSKPTRERPRSQPFAVDLLNNNAEIVVKVVVTHRYLLYLTARSSKVQRYMAFCFKRVIIAYQDADSAWARSLETHNVTRRPSGHLMLTTHTGSDVSERKYGPEHGATRPVPSYTPKSLAIKPSSHTGWGNKSVEASEYIEDLLVS